MGTVLRMAHGLQCAFAMNRVVVSLLVACPLTLCLAAGCSSSPSEGEPVVTDPSKLALCSGVVAVTALAVYASDGTIKEWRYHDLDVESVTTPGVTFTKDGAGTSGSRRRRHHHHH